MCRALFILKKVCGFPIMLPLKWYQRDAEVKKLCSDDRVSMEPVFENGRPSLITLGVTIDPDII